MAKSRYAWWPAIPFRHSATKRGAWDFTTALRDPRAQEDEFRSPVPTQDILTPRCSLTGHRPSAEGRAIHCAPFGGGSGSGRSKTEIAWWWPLRTQLATIPDSCLGVTFWTVTVTPRTAGLEGDLQVVLDDHGEAAQLLVIAVRVDRGLFDQSLQFVAGVRRRGAPAIAGRGRQRCRRR